MSRHQSIILSNKIQLFINKFETFELEIFIEKHVENVKQTISCPVCWDIVKYTKQHSQCCHVLCIECDLQIMSIQQKCPICRKCWICTTENCICNDSDTDSDSDSDSDSENMINSDIDYLDMVVSIDEYIIVPGDSYDIPTFEGTNDMPTTNLFPGRRWFNISTKQVTYYLEGQWLDEIVYMDNPQHYSAESLFAIKLITGINQSENFDFDSNFNCKICGIQRTTEVNNYIINDIRFVKFYYRTNTFVDGNLYTDNYCWGTNAFDGNKINYCFNCYCVRDALLTSIPTY